MRPWPAREGKNGWPVDSHALRSSGLARNTMSGTSLSAASCHATSKQNDLRRMSYDRAVDLSGTRDSSIRTVTSGSARQSMLIRSTMSAGISTGAWFRGRTTTYPRNAARTAAAVELKYSGGSMKPHSLNAEPLVTARR